MTEVAGQTILVVDDESDIRTLCKVNLEYEGYRVIEAGGGQQALELAHSEALDLIVLDLMMPEMDGWQVMEELQKSDVTSHIPVIVLTALADEESQLRGWAEGVLDYVTKPFNPLSLSRYVAAALKERDPKEDQERRRQIIERIRRMKDLREKQSDDES